jgi:hypothetical protein
MSTIINLRPHNIAARHHPPQAKTTMNILYSDYQYLLSKRDFPGQPAYDILHRIFLELESIKEEQKETREFLEMAIEDKKQFRLENEELRDRVKSLENSVKRLESIIARSVTFTHACI